MTYDFFREMPHWFIHSGNARVNYLRGGPFYDTLPNALTASGFLRGSSPTEPGIVRITNPGSAAVVDHLIKLVSEGHCVIIDLHFPLDWPFEWLPGPGVDEADMREYWENSDHQTNLHTALQLADLITVPHPHFAGPSTPVGKVRVLRDLPDVRGWRKRRKLADAVMRFGQAYCDLILPTLDHKWNIFPHPDRNEVASS